MNYNKFKKIKLEDTYLMKKSSKDSVYNRLSKNNITNLKELFEKDLAFVVDDNVDSFDIISEIKKSGGKLLTDIKVFDIYKGEKLDSNKKSIAYNLTFEDNTRTLTEDEVMLVFNNIIRNVESKLNASLRDK